MDKLKMHSLNKVDENVEKIGKLFPNTLTEAIKGYDEDGTPIIEYTIDFDILKQELSNIVVEGQEERYQFTWPDKKKSILLANAPIEKTLRPCREESVDFDNTQNLYIEGDNLDVLKLLQETYLNKVKIIYIDPPYNTGKDFVYADNFNIATSEYLANSGQFDAQGNRLVQNTESNGRFHTDWLNMIYPRLKLSKDLLTDDGVIFISIDDNEVENLKKICNEVFGEANFVGCLILQTATDNNPRQINTEHEYMLCYAKNKSSLDYWQAESEKAKKIQAKYFELKAKFDTNFDEIQNELRKWIKSNYSILEGMTHYDNVDEKGVFHDGDIANTIFGGYKYDVIHPVTGKPCKVPEKGFRFSETTMRQMIANGDIMFGSDETTLIKPKKRIENAKDVLRSIIYEDGRSSTKHFERLMDRDIFQNPKSNTVLLRLLNFVIKPNDIVLDFFSGSGTTAEAVMELAAQLQKQFSYIMVQLPEDLDKSLESADPRAKKTIKNAISFLDKIHKPHTVAEIGKERIRRAGKEIAIEINQANVQIKIGEESKKVPDIGFRVLKVDSTNMKDVYYNPAAYTQTMLDKLEDNIKDDRTPEDLLFQIMLDLGVLLSSDIKETVICGKKVFSVANNYLIACFDHNVSEEVVTEIAKLQPYYAVFRDSSIATDSVATNFEQIFNTYSKTTVRKVL